MKYIIALIIGFGFSQIPAMAATPAEKTAAISMECKLLKTAYDMVQKTGRTARSDIMVGCPGYENWSETTTAIEGNKLLMRAMRAKTPQAAKKYRSVGKALFKRMILRTVPVEIAQKLAETKLFAETAMAIIASRK